MCSFSELGRHSVILVGIFLGLLDLHAASGFTTAGRRILRDGSPFFAQGVCYQPTPIGNNNTTGEPHGDYYTANYSAIYNRDLPLLRAMGANVIRVYGWKSNTSHADFLDRCHNGGTRPIFVILNSWINPATNWSDANAVSALCNHFVAIENNVGQHPAVLGLIIGNEVNSQNGNGNNPAFWAAMNTIATAIKAANPSRLVSVAITDALHHVSGYNSVLSAMDFWSVQVYRQPVFGTFFTDYAAASKKPLIVTEFGLDAFDHANNREYPNGATFIGDKLTTLWGNVFTAGTGSSAVCSGACVFEYSDEWYKVGDANDPSGIRHDAGGWAASWFPDGYADEEWWGLYAIAPGNPNVLTPRAGVAALTALWQKPLWAATQPASLVVRVGDNAKLQFSAVSPFSIQYKWRRDSTPITGGTDGNLTISPASWTDAGVYQATATANGGNLDSAIVQIVVHDEAYLNYQSWAAAIFTSAELANPAVSGPGADPDRCGVSNLLRYAFKNMPARGAVTAPPVSVERGAAGSVVIRFARRTYDPKIRYTVETCSDLVNWAAIQTVSPGYPASQEIPYTPASAGEPKRFFRVRVELLP
jgi:hypothetical protein